MLLPRLLAYEWLVPDLILGAFSAVSGFFTEFMPSEFPDFTVVYWRVYFGSLLSLEFLIHVNLFRD